MRVPDEGNSRNVLYALSYISKLLLSLHIGLHTIHQFNLNEYIKMQIKLEAHSTRAWSRRFIKPLPIVMYAKYDLQ